MKNGTPFHGFGSGEETLFIALYSRSVTAGSDLKNLGTNFGDIGSRSSSRSLEEIEMERDILPSSRIHYSMELGGGASIEARSQLPFLLRLLLISKRQPVLS